MMIYLLWDPLSLAWKSNSVCTNYMQELRKAASDFKPTRQYNVRVALMYYYLGMYVHRCIDRVSYNRWKQNLS